MDLGIWIGANLFETYTANLNVYGAEESDEYEFEESFDGNLKNCLEKLKEYWKIIKDNGLDAYLSLDAWRGSMYLEGDLYNILDGLLDRGCITKEMYDACYYE